MDGVKTFAKNVLSIILLPLLCSLVGFLVGYAWDNLLKDSKAWFFAVLGALIGFLFFPIRQWLVSSGKQLELETVEVELPFLGPTFTVKLNDAQRVVGWKLFIESSTRIATRSLATDEGIIREALTSLYKLFEITRTELKSMKPSPIPDEPDTYTVETYALKMLNDGLRPLLARWHPRLSKWEKTGLPESEWPLATHCREDLEITREIMLAYTWGLGQIVKATQLDQLLPPKPAARRQLVLPNLIAAREQEFESVLLDTQRTAGWHILVELESRIATQPMRSDEGLLSEALTSLYTLFDFIRTELKSIPPPPAMNGQRQNADTVQSIGLRVLNTDLRPFLAKWHPKLSKWQKEHETESEENWPEQQSCREELEKTRAALEQEARKLKTLLRI